MRTIQKMLREIKLGQVRLDRFKRNDSYSVPSEMYALQATSSWFVFTIQTCGASGFVKHWHLPSIILLSANRWTSSSSKAATGEGGEGYSDAGRTYDYEGADETSTATDVDASTTSYTFEPGSHDDNQGEEEAEEETCFIQICFSATQFLTTVNQTTEMTPPTEEIVCFYEDDGSPAE